MNCVKQADGTTNCEMNCFFYLERTLKTGHSGANLLLVVKVLLLAIVWMTALRVHNDFSKQYVVIITIPITIHVCTSILINILETICRFPNMTIINSLYLTEEQCELVTRHTFLASTLLFMVLQLLALRNREFKKSAYSLLFALVLLLVSLISFLYHYYHHLIPIEYAELVFQYFSLTSVVAFALTFLVALFVLLYQKLRHIEGKRLQQKRLFFTIPLCIFIPLTLLEKYRSDYKELVSATDKICPVFFLLLTLVCLPSFRKNLLFCCDPHRDTTVYPICLIEESQDVKKRPPTFAIVSQLQPNLVPQFNNFPTTFPANISVLPNNGSTMYPKIDEPIDSMGIDRTLKTQEMYCAESEDNSTNSEGTAMYSHLQNGKMYSSKLYSGPNEVHGAITPLQPHVLPKEQGCTYVLVPTAMVYQV